jgi:hypothetical protein
MTDTLAEFLLTRIEEDVVKRVTMREWHAADCDAIPEIGSEYTYPCDCGVPERMARECEAKRQIVARCMEDTDADPELLNVGVSPEHWLGSNVLRFLALPYADHPDYRQEWKP